MVRDLDRNSDHDRYHERDRTRDQLTTRKPLKSAWLKPLKRTEAVEKDWSRWKGLKPLKRTEAVEKDWSRWKAGDWAWIVLWDTYTVNMARLYGGKNEVE
jgi:hypothetical protein